MSTVPRTLPTSPAPGGLPTADASRLSLSWFALALCGLLVAGLWLLCAPSLFSGDHSHSSTVGWVHALVLGFLSTTTFGAVYQLLPVVLGEPLAFGRLPWLHLPVHLLGCVGLIVSFVLGSYQLVAVFGSVLLFGFVLFALNSLGTFRRTKRKDVVAWAFCASTAWLLLAALAGLLAALNRLHGFMPQPLSALLRLHAHVGLLGFFLTMIQGAAFRLLPMFTLGDVRDWDRVLLGLVLSQAGLLGLSFSWLENLEAGRLVFALLLCAGFALSANEARALLARRRKRVLDQGLQAFITGACFLAATAFLGLLSLLTPWFDGSLNGQLPLLYGLLLIGGGLLPLVCGMLLKIFPFLVWMRAYSGRLGRGPVPLASQLSEPRLEQAWLETHLLSLVLLALSLARPEAFWRPLGAGVFLLSIVLLLLNFSRIALHLRAAPSSVPSPRNPSA